MMTREEIEAIRKRAEKATKGSWKWQEYYDCSLSNSEGNVIVEAVGDDMSYVRVLRDEDAEFITHAREDIPKLLAEIERLRCETGEINHETTKLITPIVTSTANE